MAAIQTVDFFPPIIDDPFKYGRIAAATALSDIYAMGAKPHLVMNLLCFNTAELPLEVAADILAGGADAIIESGAILVGGQTMEDNIPKYGLCVTSFYPADKILTNAGARTGDVIILTKAIGTAVIMGANRADVASEEEMNITIDQMCRLNKYAVEAVEDLEVHSCTDITGFGLIGHALEMAEASRVTIEIDYDSVPKLPRADFLAKEGFSPCQAHTNLAFVNDRLYAEGVEPHKLALLAEPQTSGGLLFSLPADAAETALSRLKNHDPDSAIIGRVDEKSNHVIRIV